MNADAVSEAMRKTLGTLWEKNLPIMRERVDELLRAAHDAKAGKLNAEARKSAEGTAHKLAGSLGMFGYKRGTEIARELEQLLEGGDALDAECLSVLTLELRSQLNL